MKGRQEKFVMQMEYPQCLFQVHEFESTQHYLDTLHQSKSWVHTQVGCRNMALTFNGCMMHYEFAQDVHGEVYDSSVGIAHEAAEGVAAGVEGERGVPVGMEGAQALVT